MKNTVLMYDFFLQLQTAGLWSAISAIVALLGLLLAYRFVRMRSYIRGLNFFIQHRREDNTIYPSKLSVEIRNFSGKTVVLAGPYFKFGSVIPPDENARCDSYVKEYEVKFADPHQCYLQEVEIMLRHKEITTTWIPIDPSVEDEAVTDALRNHQVGVLMCNTVWLEDRPKIMRIRKKI